MTLSQPHRLYSTKQDEEECESSIGTELEKEVAMVCFKLYKLGIWTLNSLVLWGWQSYFNL
jgi:hypothetical protein